MFPDTVETFWAVRCKCSKKLWPLIFYKPVNHIILCFVIPDPTTWGYSSHSFERKVTIFPRTLWRVFLLMQLLILSYVFPGINLINSCHYSVLLCFSFAEFGYLLFGYLLWILLWRAAYFFKKDLFHIWLCFIMFSELKPNSLGVFFSFPSSQPAKWWLCLLNLNSKLISKEEKDNNPLFWKFKASSIGIVS